MSSVSLHFVDKIRLEPWIRICRTTRYTKGKTQKFVYNCQHNSSESLLYYAKQTTCFDHLLRPSSGLYKRRCSLYACDSYTRSRIVEYWVTVVSMVYSDGGGRCYY
jgi:hypothetical protein